MLAVTADLVFVSHSVFVSDSFAILLSSSLVCLALLCVLLLSDSVVILNKE